MAGGCSLRSNRRAIVRSEYTRPAADRVIGPCTVTSQLRPRTGPARCRAEPAGAALGPVQTRKRGRDRRALWVPGCVPRSRAPPRMQPNRSPACSVSASSAQIDPQQPRPVSRASISSVYVAHAVFGDGRTSTKPSSRLGPVRKRPARTRVGLGQRALSIGRMAKDQRRTRSPSPPGGGRARRERARPRRTSGHGRGRLRCAAARHPATRRTRGAAAGGHPGRRSRAIPLIAANLWFGRRRATVEVDARDRRFADPAWAGNPAFTRCGWRTGGGRFAREVGAGRAGPMPSASGDAPGLVPTWAPRTSWPPTRTR